jgi:hypothetical protein
MNARIGVLLLSVLVLGCEAATAPPATGSGVAVPPGPPGVSGDAAADFIATYREASEKNDLEGLMRLYCWDGVPADLRETIRGNAKDELLSTIDTIEIVPGSDMRETAVEGGIHWKANLKPVAQVNVTFKPGRPGDFLVSKLSWGLGMKNGRYLISVSVPQ